MSYVQINNVTKQFSSNTVLRDLSLSIDKGELVTLLGPSGCGKSTLLRCIAGLAGMGQGTIALDGRDITGTPPKDRGVGMVFQSYALFPNMTASQNIAFGLNMRGTNREETARRTAEMLRLIDMEDKKNAYPHELSGGQQQRVALARSLAVSPKLMLMDEPLSALDAKIRKNLRVELRQIQKQVQMTTIFVTHDQEEALTISDRVCVMDNGVIVQSGTPEEIYTNPRTEFVARFIGNYNVLTGSQLAGLSGGAEVFRQGAAGAYALRPEAVRLFAANGSGADTGGSASFTVPAIVRDMSVLGNILRYTVETADSIKLTVDAINDNNSWVAQGSNIIISVPFKECRRLEG